MRPMSTVPTVDQGQEEECERRRLTKNTYAWTNTHILTFKLTSIAVLSLTVTLTLI
jgi:hypothetical protein